MKTITLKSSQIKRSWYLINLKDKILGRTATQIAFHLLGKNKPLLSPNLDNGDFVVAINAKFIKLTGKKLKTKLYQSHSGFPGGFKEETLKSLLARSPKKVIEKAVRGMLPKNKYRQIRMQRLKVYPEDKHPYTAVVNNASSEHIKSTNKNKK